MTENEKLVKHLERIIGNLNQHWDSIILLLSYVSKPLIIDDRGLNSVLCELRKSLKESVEKLETLDISKTLGEIKYIGNRLLKIEQRLDKIQIEGVKSKIRLDINLDGKDLAREEIKSEEINEEIFKGLTKKQVLVVKERLKGKTFVEIHKIAKVSQARCGMIYKQAIRKLTHYSKRHLIEKCSYSQLKEEVLGSLPK